MRLVNRLQYKTEKFQSISHTLSFSTRTHILDFIFFGERIMVQHIQTLDEFNAAIGKDVFTVIDFTATWCGPCKMIAPHFEKLAQENPEIQFFKVDVDDSSDIAEACSISAMPTFKFYKSGNEVGTLTGANIGALIAKVAALK